MGIKIKGVAHTAINVSDFEKCVNFYESILTFLGLTQVFKGSDTIYFVGGHTALGVGRCDKKFENERFDQKRIGLHHICFRANSEEDIDKFYTHLKSINANIVHKPERGPWAPGYYSVLFEDPCGTRLELNYVPKKGVLEEGVKFNSAGDYK